MEFPCTWPVLKKNLQTKRKVKHLSNGTLKREPFLLLFLCTKLFCYIENDFFFFQVKKEAKVQFMATEVHGKFACKRS